MRPNLFRFLIWFVPLLVALSSTRLVHARDTGAELKVSVLTMGPGDHPFLKFGHNAIWVENSATGAQRIYNFGTFSFNSSTLITDFLQGRLKYWLSIQSPRSLHEYVAANRSLTVQELDLTPAERELLAKALAENARPENREYTYDYYMDNCATRVRDALDRIVKNRLHAVAKKPASMSFRAHTLRLVADDLPLYLALHLALGSAADRPITEWDEMFLPAKVQEHLRRVQVSRESGEVPFVKRESVLFAAKRAALRTEPPNWTVWGLLSGLSVGALLTLAGRESQRRGVRIAFGTSMALLGLVAGFLGCVFVMFWGFTDHAIAHRNENILQCAPWALLLVVTGAAVAFGKRGVLRINWLIVLGAALASALGLLLKLLPSFIQDNTLIVACMLPVWLGAALGSYFMYQRAAVKREQLL